MGQAGTGASVAAVDLAVILPIAYSPPMYDFGLADECEGWREGGRNGREGARPSSIQLREGGALFMVAGSARTISSWVRWMEAFLLGFSRRSCCVGCCEHSAGWQSGQFPMSA